MKVQIWIIALVLALAVLVYFFDCDEWSLEVPEPICQLRTNERVKESYTTNQIKFQVAIKSNFTFMIVA